MIKKLKANKTDIAIIFIFLILPLLFFRDITKINSTIFGTWDTLLYTIPLRQLNAELLRSFQLPLWNGYIFSGFPLLANPQVGVLYPLNLIFDLFLPIKLSFNISLLLNYSLAGIFSYLFLNEYKLHKISSFVGGLIFMFSGIMVTHRSHPQMLNTIIWLPLILFFLEKFKNSKNNIYISIATGCLCICYLGGHPQMFVYSSLIIVLYIIYYAFIYNGGKNYFFLKSFLIFPLTLLIIGFVFFPTLQLSELSSRNILSRDYNFITSSSFDIKLFPELVFPFIFGNKSTLPNVLPYFGPVNYAEMMIYFGISTLPFLFLGFFKKDKNKYIWIFILLVSFLLVLGRYTPFYRIIDYIPVINNFRIPSRNWFEFGFAFSVLASFGFDYFINEKSKKVKNIIKAVIIFLLVILTSSLFFFYNINFRNAIITALKKIKLYEIDFGNNISSLNTFNYSIHIPIIIMSVAIIILVISLFKKNKFIYVLLVALIFLDLLSVGYYFEDNYNSSYIINKKTSYPKEMSFLQKNDKDPFRIFPIADTMSYYFVSPNRSMHYNLESITGYDPLMLNDYRFLTDIPDHPYVEMPWEKLLINNNIISMLNAKYIIVNNQSDAVGFINSLSRYYWTEGKSKLNTYSENFKTKNAEFNPKTNEILFGDKENVLKIIEIPFNVEKNKDYMISFEIKSEKKLNNFVFFDFFGPKYDNQDQGFFLKPEEIHSDYVKIIKIINSGNLPDGISALFRAFTESSNSFTIKDLSVHELKKVNNYKLVLQNFGVVVIENINYLPRFSFPERIIKVKGISDVKKILNDEDNYLESDRFNPLKTALVEGLDIPEKEFLGRSGTVDILDYKNNKIILKANLDEDRFMVFSDTFYPGWKATVDGKETKIYKTDGIIKGIFIPKGIHNIEFKYIPDYLYILIVISPLSILLIFLIPIIIKKRKIKNIKKTV